MEPDPPAQPQTLLEIEARLEEMLGAAFPRGLKRNASDHTFKLPNGAVIECGQLNVAEDYRKFQGRSVTMLTVEEIGEVRDRSLVEKVRSNLRAPEGIPLRTIYTANPGGPQHAYLHQTFVSAAPAWTPFQVEGETWIYAPSTLLDNPFVDHADYERKLRAACGN
jgi:hypothetical protein